jgi:hypothetical protein
MAQSNAVGTIVTLGVIGAAAWALYEWLSKECTTLGSSMIGGSVCNTLFPVPASTGAPAGSGQLCVGPPWYTQASCAQIQGTFSAAPANCGAPAGYGICEVAPPPTAPATPPAVTQTTAVLSNATSPGAPFAAGDSFQLIVTGPPNSPVIGTASQNGAVSSSSSFGSTDANGQKIITGGWTAADIGSWQETWQVGSATPAALNFSIAASGVSGLSSNRVPIDQIHRMRFL